MFALLSHNNADGHILHITAVDFASSIFLDLFRTILNNSAWKNCSLSLSPTPSLPRPLFHPPTVFLDPLANNSEKWIFTLYVFTRGIAEPKYIQQKPNQYVANEESSVPFNFGKQMTTELEQQKNTLHRLSIQRLLCDGSIFIRLSLCESIFDQLIGCVDLNASIQIFRPILIWCEWHKSVPESDSAEQITKTECSYE